MNILSFLAVICAVVLIGALIVRLFRACPIDIAIFSFPFGAGIVTLVLFSLNQFAVIAITYRTICTVLGFCVMMAGAAHIFRRGHPSSSSRPLPDAPLGGEGSFYGRLCTVSIASVFALLFAYTLMVPADTWDAWTYHLPIARTIFMHGALPRDVSLCNLETVNAFPVFIQILYAIEHIVCGYPHYWLFKVLPLVFGGLCCILVYRVCRLCFWKDRESALSAVILCVSMEIFLTFMIWDTVAITFTFFCLGAFYCLGMYHRQGDKRFLLLAGMNLGFAYWTKYAGALFAVVLMLTLLAEKLAAAVRKQKSALNLTLPAMAAIVLPALAIASPHLIRNFLFYGNPVYPALAGIIGGRNIDPWALAHTNAIPTSLGFLPWFDVFYTGFLAPLFLFIYLLSRKWWKASLELTLTLLFFAYYAAYLILLRYPPSAGDSTKYLLPTVCLAAVLGGVAMRDMFVRGLSRRITIVMIALLMIWQIVTCRQELLLGRWDYWPIASLYSWRSWLKFFDGLIFDFYQTGVIIVVILCWLVNAPGIRIGPRLKKCLLVLAMAAMLGQVFQQILLPLVKHIDRALRDPGCHLIEEIYPRWLMPEGGWMEKNLPKEAVLFTFETRIYLLPRKIFPADSYRLKELYRAESVEKSIELLKVHGITHIYLDEIGPTHPLYGEMPFLGYLDDPRYFELIYSSRERILEPGKAAEVRIYEIR